MNLQRKPSGKQSPLSLHPSKYFRIPQTARIQA
jgi:hypothetical protein